MTHQEADQRAHELTEHFRKVHPDLIAHVDIVEGTNDIVISFFWNRISVDRWKDAQTFRCKGRDYQNVLDNEIIPFFN